MRRTKFLAVGLLLAALVASGAAAETDVYSVRDFGAKADGKTDDTAAFQKALDTL